MNCSRHLGSASSSEVVKPRALISLFLEYTQCTFPWIVFATPEPVNPSTLYYIYSNHHSISKEHTLFLTLQQ